MSCRRTRLFQEEDNCAASFGRDCLSLVDCYTFVTTVTCDDRVEAFKLNLNLKRTINDAKIQASPRTAYSSLDPIIGPRIEMDETKIQNRSLGSRGRRSRSIVLKLIQYTIYAFSSDNQRFFFGRGVC